MRRLLDWLRRWFSGASAPEEPDRVYVVDYLNLNYPELYSMHEHHRRIDWPEDFFEQVFRRYDQDLDTRLARLRRAEAGKCNGQALYWAPAAITVQVQ